MYTITLTINSKILLYNYYLQLPISNLLSQASINQYQLLHPIKIVVSLFRWTTGKNILFHLWVFFLISLWNRGPLRTTEKIYVFGRFGLIDTSTSFSTISNHCFRWLNLLTIITLGYTRYLIFIFVVYDVIYRRKAAFSYSLLAKSSMGEKTKELICKITHAQLINTTTKIKNTN